MPPVPRAWSDLTPGWMTAALAGSFPGAVVSGVEVVDVVAGTNARARARLEYSSGNGPARVFVKREGRVFNRLALLALGAWAAEARLTESGLVLPATHPRSYFAAVDPRRLASVVVMEDITLAGGRPVDPTVALSVAQVRHGLHELAALHAAYWRRTPEGIGPWRLGAVWAPVSAASLANGLRKLGRSGPAVKALRLERQFRGWATTARSGPQTLLHGDPHPGNTYARPDDGLGFYDWQLVRAGHGLHDVGYFIGGALDPPDRRVHEGELVDDYLAELRRLGITAPSSADAWNLYAQTPAFGLATWLHTLSGGGFQPFGVCRATIDRFSASYFDHRLDRS